MSATIDQRVVEMRFDNKQFESNVSTTMSTLDKLKQKLNLSGAAKGLEDVGSATKSINLSGLGGAVEAVHVKFSALQVMGITALSNITNSAVNAGKRIVSALTIDPIKTGFQEYETQINAVQTILANTKSKGTTIDDVNSALDELNTYADKTIYNFTEMTRNIGTFTAAGVDLDKSVTSIKGIANLAAVSGSTSQQASTAMYQLSQALAAGKVSLMDWNSVVNAGMGGEVFQTALKRTATQMGTNVDAMIEKYGSFRESLTQGQWLTAEVLTETLTQLSGAYSEADLIAQGYTEQQAKDIVELSKTAESAATDVKTFTQLWDTLKESAQSGWTQTWELIVGDFEEAKSLLSGVSKVLNDMIGSSAESRNKLLSEALVSNWDKITSKINEAGIETTAFEDKVREVAKAHDIDIDTLVKQYGSLEKVFQSGAVSSDILKEAVGGLGKSLLDLSSIERELKKGDRGDDVKKLQEALKTLGYDIGKNGVDGVLGGYTESAIKAFQQANDLKVTGIVDEETLAALEKAGTKTAEFSDSLDELIDGVTNLGGRAELIESFKNIFEGLVNIVKPVKEAFKDIFPPITADNILGFIDNFKSLTVTFKEFGTKYSDQIKRTFTGIFSIIDIGKKIFTAFAKSISELTGSSGVKKLGEFILDTVASIGDFFTSLNKNFDVNGVADIFSGLASGISSALGVSVDILSGFGKALSAIGDIICDVASSIWKGVKTVFGWISENFSAGDIFAGLAGGGIFVLAKKLIGFVDGIKEAFEGLFGKGGEKAEGIREKFGNLLDGVHESLESFSSGIKVGSIVAIAVAIGILSASLNTISKLDVGDVSKGLFAIGAMLTMLTLGFRSMTKTLSLFDSKGIVKSSFSLILVAAAIKILAGAMEKIGGLSFGEIVKGLVGIGGGIVLLCSGLKFLSGTKVSLGTSVAMLALAEACKILGDAMGKFANLSWEEIGRGLVGMGGALAEMVAALAILSKVGGFGTLLGSVGILIAVQSLSDMTDALKEFGSMQWGEIGRGLVGMGGALTEVAGITGLLGKLAGFSSIFASGAILIVVQGLEKLTESFKNFGSMSWEEIGRGLVGMGGALGEVAGITGVLGKLAGFSSIFASGAILITIQGLSELADAFKSFGSMSWEEIGLALVGMGGALAEVAGITGVLGSLAGFSSIFASGAIFITIQGLSDLAESFKKFGSMSWEEIGRGLVGMGGALTEVAGITGALGALAGLPALLGSGAILLAVQGLGDLADAFKKFGEMSWDEIGRGLSAMGGALGEVALGGFLSTLSGIGAMAISEMAAPLGTLADSVQKWSGVEVPEGLGMKLAALANGVMSFTFGGLGASALSTAAPGVGIMADSVQKWSGVTIPDGLTEKLGTLASGIEKFTFSGLGAGALSTAAPGIGAMADSVQKWSGVTVPENIGDNLEKLADGVQAFSFAFMGGWSISSIVDPLSSLADSVKKWDGVKIPDGLPDDLTELADAVTSFTWAFVGAWSIGSVSGPLSSLADAVNKWKTVTIPDGLSDGLSGLATAVKKFSGVEGVSTTASGMNQLASASEKMAGVSYSSISNGLTSIATAITELNSVESSISGLGEKIVNEIATPIKNASGMMRKNGTELISVFVNAVKSTQSKVTSAGKSLADSAVNALKSKNTTFKTAGEKLGSSLVEGLENKEKAASKAGKGLGSEAASGASDKSSSMESAGYELGDGLVAGINAMESEAYWAGYALGQAAVEGERDGQASASPSKETIKSGKWLGEGLVIGMQRMSRAVYNAGSTMGKDAIGSISNSVSRIADAINTDIDAQPTIRPILDLSDVKTGANAIGSMLDTGSSIGVLANVNGISTMMNRRSQNGANSEVVSAIDKLRKDIGNIQSNSYSIGGVSYDDGSAVGNAVLELVRAIKVEGRI